MHLKTPREKRILYIKTAFRWILYILIIFICFVLMTTGSWTKPIFLVPVALCIAMNNDTMISAFTGAFCGFMIDIACGRLFGYNAVILTIFCTAVSLLYDLYFRRKFFNYLWITALAAFFQCWLDYKFYYEMWNYDDVEFILYDVSLKVWLYTVISSVVIYFIFRIINKFLMPKEHLTIQEVIKSNQGRN